MVNSHSHVEVEVRVYAQDHLDLGLLSPGADHRHVPSSFRCGGHLFTRGAGENGRYCEGSCHQRAPMRSRRCPAPGGRWATPRCPADESLARHLWPTWKEGQAAPRRRPQPFSRILTAWKDGFCEASCERHSRKFGLLSTPPVLSPDGPPTLGNGHGAQPSADTLPISARLSSAESPTAHHDQAHSQLHGQGYDLQISPLPILGSSPGHCATGGLHPQGLFPEQLPGYLFDLLVRACHQ